MPNRSNNIQIRKKLLFALVAMFFVFVALFEFSQIVAVERKIREISPLIANRVVETDALNYDELRFLKEASQRRMFPFRNKVQIFIAGLIVTDEVAIVQWVYNPEKQGKISPGMTYTIPENWITNGAYLIVVNAKAEHRPVIEFVGAAAELFFPGNASLVLSSKTIKMVENNY